MFRCRCSPIQTCGFERVDAKLRMYVQSCQLLDVEHQNHEDRDVVGWPSEAAAAAIVAPVPLSLRAAHYVDESLDRNVDKLLD